MRIVLFFISFCNWVHLHAQTDDSLSYFDPNLLGDWELCSYVRLDGFDNPLDTTAINKDSVYWNVTLRMSADSAQEIMTPLVDREGVIPFDFKCKWRLYKEDERLWITIPCGNNVQGLNEVLFISEEYLHFLHYYGETGVVLWFRRVEFEE